jgi:hypothetical protein
VAGSEAKFVVLDAVSVTPRVIVTLRQRRRFQTGRSSAPRSARPRKVKVKRHSSRRASSLPSGPRLSLTKDAAAVAYTQVSWENDMSSE